MGLRVAFTGAASTGKTTLMNFVAETFGLQPNPVGARSVAQAMGFESPYDADAAGRRAEMQRRIVTEKIAWEAAHESFVTDRTTLDNLTYTILHDVDSLDEELYEKHVEAVRRYTHIFYCPQGYVPFKPDGVRRNSETYQRIFDHVLAGLLKEHAPFWAPYFLADFPTVHMVTAADASVRERFVRGALGKVEKLT